MFATRYPSLYQINTRVWLTELSRTFGRAATLDDVPDAALDRVAAQGFDWVWFLSVWQTGPEAQAVSRANANWRREFAETLPDLTDDDIAGSGFAIQSSIVHRDLGGDTALARLRQRLQERGLKLMLDFVQPHGSGFVDRRARSIYPWQRDRFGSFTAELLPNRKKRAAVLACGRDPFRGLARHAAAELRQPQLQNDDRRATRIAA
jgi:hypothetical protein